MKQEINWKRIWARRYTPILSTSFIMAFLRDTRFGAAPNKMFVPEGTLLAMYYEKDAYRTIVKNYSDFLHDQNIKQYAKFYENYFAGFLKSAQKISSGNLKKLTNEQLAESVEKIYDKIQESTDWQYMAFLVLDGDATELEEKLLKLPNGQKILHAITTPYKETKIVKARLELLKLAIKKNEQLKSYTKKYSFIPVSDPMDKPWTESDFKKQLKQLKNPEQELATYYAERKQALQDYQRYVRSISDPLLKKQVEIVHAFSYLKEMRDDYRRPAYLNFSYVLNEAAKRLKISSKLVPFMLPSEITTTLKGKDQVDQDELAKRYENYALVLLMGKLSILSGKEAQELGAKMLGEKKGEIRGMSAHQGLVKGRVRIVYHQGEFQLFKQGEILVTTMTHPEFASVMKKAAAIVTDEGGITCHAAITARELGIPCVIGTKNATHVLKTGDLVEVDADRGIVQKQ